MATRYAVADGNWSSTSTWDGGTLPGNGDDVYTDGKTVTIDIDLTGSYRPANLYAKAKPGGGTAGGRFNVTTTRQIGESGYPVGIYGSDLTSARYGCVTFSGGSGTTLTIYGNVTGGSGQYAYGVYNYSTGTITITGNVTGGPVSDATGVYNYGTGTITITGNVTGGPVSNATGVFNNSTGTITITGNVTGGPVSNATGVHNYGTGTITITGDVTGGSGQYAYGVNNYDTGTITITGTVTGKSDHGVYSTTDGTLVITGDCYADPAPAVYWTGSAAYCEIRGNQYGGVSDAAQGTMAVVTYKQAIPQVADKFIRMAEAGSSPGSYSGNTGYFYGALAGSFGHPATGDVRYGVTYGPNNELTGTCRVPAPQSVAYGVPVDNTTGTAVITRDDVQAAVWDDAVIETGVTARKMMRLLGACGGGVLSGAGTAAITIKAANDPNVTRVHADVDGSGNRLAVSLSL